MSEAQLKYPVPTAAVDALIEWAIWTEEPAANAYEICEAIERAGCKIVVVEPPRPQEPPHKYTPARPLDAREEPAPCLLCGWPPASGPHLRWAAANH